jgi:hypothetical protein
MRHWLRHDFHRNLAYSGSRPRAGRSIESRRGPEGSVESIKATARSKPWVAWPIIGFVAVTAIVAAINQVWELVKKIVDLNR